MKSINLLGERQHELLKALLHNRDGLSIEELSSKLSISRNAVVQHINSLVASNYIESSMRASTGGRPSRVYMLTEVGLELFPRHYALFSKVLIDLLDKEMGVEAIQGFMKSLGNALADQYIQKIDGALPLAEKVAIVREIMYELGYETRTSEHPSEDEIVADNCIFHQLAEDNEQVCQLDIQLMTKLTGASVDHTECMVRGGNCCRFKITKS